MLEMSLKNLYQFNVYRWLPTLPWHVDNYVIAWSQVVGYLWNSFVIATVTVIISITASSLTAYVLARFDFPGRSFFYFAVISLLMIPGVLTLITTFWVVLKLGLVNTYWGLWFPMAAFAQAFQIFVLRTFFASLPEELFEAARMDGAGDLRALWLIAIPLSRPIFATLAVLQFLAAWNEYIWPLMVIRDDVLQPVSVALLHFNGIFQTEWGPLFAGYTLAALPLFVLFMFTSRYFVQGLLSGAVRI
jgi:multiple sugar transport system permease protein/raffinose/stachyose/melibiose transport system permease protein